MFIIDLYLSIGNFFDDIRDGKRYGFGSFLWKLAVAVCLFLAFLFFYLRWKVPGIVAILGAVGCFICSCCRIVRDIRKQGTESAAEQN